MRELPEPDDWFQITGRGPVACYSERKWDPIPRNGEHVLIAGEEFVIIGIEQSAIMSMGTDAYWDVPRGGAFLVKKEMP